MSEIKVGSRWIDDEGKPAQVTAVDSLTDGSSVVAYTHGLDERPSLSYRDVFLGLYRERSWQPWFCPICGSDDIDSERSEMAGETATEDYRCNACGALWVSEYALTHAYIVGDDAREGYRIPHLDGDLIKAAREVVDTYNHYTNYPTAIAALGTVLRDLGVTV